MPCSVVGTNALHQSVLHSKRDPPRHAVYGINAFAGCPILQRRARRSGPSTGSSSSGHGRCPSLSSRPCSAAPRRTCSSSFWYVTPGRVLAFSLLRSVSGCQKGPQLAVVALPEQSRVPALCICWCCAGKQRVACIIPARSVPAPSPLRVRKHRVVLSLHESTLCTYQGSLPSFYSC